MNPGMFNLSGKVAIVTGGNGGIGLGLARGLADAGANIAIVGRNEAKSNAAVADIAARGVKSISITADVTNKTAVSRMVERVVGDLGSADILVNNAGINVRKPPHVLEIEEWESVIDTNLTSAFLCSKAVYPAMKAGWRRQDHQYRIDDVDLRREFHAGLRREQRRHCAIHPRLRLRVGQRQHPGQRDSARLDRHRSHNTRPHRGSRLERTCARPDACRAMGQDRRFCGNRGVPELARF